jgi:hypothetical protein
VQENSFKKGYSIDNGIVEPKDHHIQNPTGNQKDDKIEGSRKPIEAVLELIDNLNRNNQATQNKKK